MATGYHYGVCFKWRTRAIVNLIIVIYNQNSLSHLVYKGILWFHNLLLNQFAALIRSSMGSMAFLRFPHPVSKAEHILREDPKDM